MDRALLVLLIAAAVAAVALLLRRRQAAGAPRRIEPGAVGLGGDAGVGVVGFSSPYCLPCRSWEARLREAGVPWAKVDVARRGDLARRYGVSQTPLVLAVSLPEGRVLEAYEGEPDAEQVERLRALAAA